MPYLGDSGTFTGSANAESSGFLLIHSCSLDPKYNPGLIPTHHLALVAVGSLLEFGCPTQLSGLLCNGLVT